MEARGIRHCANARSAQSPFIFFRITFRSFITGPLAVSQTRVASTETAFPLEQTLAEQQVGQGKIRVEHRRRAVEFD